MARTQLTRDPFARASLVREVVKIGQRQCEWCGSKPGRFRYWWESDAAHQEPIEVRVLGFCSIGCWRDYHGNGGQAPENDPCPECGSLKIWVPTYCNFGHCADCFRACDPEHDECGWNGVEHESYGPGDTLPGRVHVGDCPPEDN
jgi:hypothetical protein